MPLAPDVSGSPSASEAADASQASRPSRPPQPVRIVLADDHVMVRRNLRRLLEAERDFQVIAEAGDLAAAVRHVHGQLPHVLVLDLGLPNGSSLEAISRLRERVPETEIVVLTMEESPLFARRALDAGAIGFVLKHHADSELPLAVRAASRGCRYVSPRVAAGLEALSRLTADSDLSPREVEVLRLIALGYTSAEIAAQLHLSRRTVETHRAHIHRKLGLATRAELVRYALDRRLIGA
jgi:two-component system response regulator NreC